MIRMLPACLPACLPAAFDSPTCLSHSSSSESESRRRQSFTFLRLLLLLLQLRFALQLRHYRWHVEKRHSLSLVSHSPAPPARTGPLLVIAYSCHIYHTTNCILLFFLLAVLVTFLQTCASFLSPPSEREVMFPSRSDAHDFACFVLCVAKMLMMFAEDAVRSKQAFSSSSFLHLVLFVHLRAHTQTDDHLFYYYYFLRKKPTTTDTTAE